MIKVEIKKFPRQKRAFKGGLQTSYSALFRETRGKTPTVDSLLNKVVGLQSATLLKRDTGACIFLQVLRNFQNQFFAEHLQATDASLIYFNGNI